MPSYEEIHWMARHLESSSSIILNGVKGRQITGKYDCECNSLFIPYSGYYRGGSLRDATEEAFVWAATTHNSVEPGPHGEINRNALWASEEDDLMDCVDREIENVAFSVRAIFKR